MRIIVISDIHGCYYTMKHLLEEVHFDLDKDKLICLGDMCDRGSYVFWWIKYAPRSLF